MAKIKLKSLATEQAKIEKEGQALAKRFKLADATGEIVVAFDLQKLLQAYVLDLSKRAEINRVLGVVTSEANAEAVQSQKVEISLKNGVTADVEGSIRATIVAKGAAEELADKLTAGVVEVVKNAQAPSQVSIGRLMKNKLSFTVDKVTHAIPTK